MELYQPKMIFICGHPFAGKTTLAERVRDELRVHHVDIDEIR